MPTTFPGPSGAFETHIKLTLSALGVSSTPSWLLVSTIMNVMVLMTITPRFKLNSISTWIILSLRNEITTLCPVYKVKNVRFQFESPLDAPQQLVDDFFALNLSGSMLNKNPTHWKNSNFTVAETQLLLNFLALVHALMRVYGSELIVEVVADYNNKLVVPLPPNHIRHTGVGPRVVNVYRGPDVATPSMAARTNNRSNVRFSPFVPRSRPAPSQPARSIPLDLNDESRLGLLSDAPLRMRRRRAFGFGLF